MNKPLHTPPIYWKQIGIRLHRATSGFCMRTYNAIITSPIKIIAILLVISALLFPGSALAQNSAVTINTSASSGGTWASSGSGATLLYTFTPSSSTSNVNSTDIVDILTGVSVSLTGGTASVSTGVPGSVTITSTCSSGGSATASITIATTITAANTSASTAYTLTFTSAGNITVNSSSAINLTASNGSGGDPAPGKLGDNVVFTAGTAKTVSISSAITTTGGTGQVSATGGTSSGAGGAAGYISITAPGGITITGGSTVLTTVGGAGAAGKGGDNSSASGAGGAGGLISLTASSGTVSTSGAAATVMISSGGAGGGSSNGFGGAGGAAGAISISSSGNITIGSTTGITANGGAGGSATQTSTAGAGGAGGLITISSSGGSVTINSSSTINSLGGAGAQANNGSVGSNGGNGSNINISGVGITVSSAITTTGGTGGSPNGCPSTGAAGGTAGNISLSSPSGAVSITAALTATGGIGALSGGCGGNVAGTGGNGGTISITGTTVSDNTAISAAGGAGGNASAGDKTNGNGGNAATIALTGSGGITMSGTISASGGAAGTGGTGGTAGTASSITLTDGNGTVTSGGVNDGISGAISGLNLSSTGTGILKVSTTNTYTGTTTISNGTLQTAAAAGIPSSSNVTLNGGILSGSGSFTENLGTLTLSSNSTLTFASGSTLFKFSDSHSASWGNNTLAVTGWTGTTGTTGTGSAGQLWFGTSTSNLTATQLSNINFSGFSNGALFTTPGTTGQIVPPSGSITTGTITGSPFCNGASISVPFTYSGTGFTTSTVYTAEISDASGSFGSPTIIGTVTGISSGSGTISATLPTSIANGTHYRINVISTSPTITGSNNGTDFTISGQSITLSSGSNTQNVCPSNAITSIVYTVSAAVSSTSISWSSTPSGISYNTGTYTISGTPTVAGTYSYTITTSGASCTAATATGTITVGQTAVLTSGLGTNTQSICVNNAIVNITYSVGTATGVTVTGGSLPTGVSGNLSGGVYTISGTPTVAGTYTYTITTSGACGSAANANGSITVIGLPAITSSVPGSPSLLYSFTSGSNLANSGSDNWGTASVSGSSQSSDRFGVSNNSYTFNGSTNFISNSTFNAPTYNPYSEGVWFKTSTPGGVLMGLSNTALGTTSTSYDHTLYMDNSGNVYFGIFMYPSNTHPVANSSGTNYADGKWHLAVGTLSSANGESLYIDGNLVGTNSSANNPSSGGEGYIVIGANNLTSWEHNPPSDNYFTGSLDEAIIYNNTELTSSQVTTMYDIGYASVTSVTSCGAATITLQDFSLGTGTYTVTYNVTGANTISSTTAIMNYTSGTPGSGTFIISLLNSGSNVVNITGISNSNGCTTSVSISTPAYTTGSASAATYTWTGAINSNWSLPANWSCAILPISTSNVTIPSVTTEPILTSNITINNIAINSGATVGLGGYTLTINGALTSTGTISGSYNSGLIFGSSASAATAYFTSAADTLGTLTLNDNTNTITLGNALNIASTGLVTVGSSAGAKLASGGYLTLVSDNNGSARVAAVPVNGSNVSQSTISGNVNVQCYVHSSNSSVSGPRRSWRLLTAPITNKNASPTGTIYSSWQNGGVYAAGIGTMITAPVAFVNSTGGQSTNGLDYGINNNYSGYTWNLGGQTLSNLTNTKVNISGTNGSVDNLGYFIFVRGDRTPSTVGRPVTAYLDNTTLSASGVLQLGQQQFISTSAGSPISGTINYYSLVGNPYACSVSFSALNTGSGLSNLYNRYSIWNSNIPGSNQVGGYITMDGTANNGKYVNSYTGTNTSTDINLQIQSGQAFFVQTIATGTASITFQESYKTTGTANNNYIYRPDQTSSQQGSSPDELFYTGLCSLNSDSTTSLIDGTVAQYGNYCNCVDGIDAPKFQNDDEMLSLTRNGKKICIERRQPIAGSDTLFLTLNQMSLENYQFKLAPTLILNNHPGLGAHLEDSYTGIHTPLNLADTNKVNFTINGNGGSQAANRFMVVFGAVNIAPVYTSIKATKEGNTVLVQWSLSNDQSMTGYVLQESTDGINYTTVYSTTAQHITGDYSWIDTNPVAGTNYYRVLSTDVLNEQSYSSAVSATFTSLDPSGIIVYPNPIENGQIGLAFNNMPSGNYRYRLLDILGQEMQTGSINHAGGNATDAIAISKFIAKGTYQLEIFLPDNTKTVISVVYE
jgi:hypothetical protein